MRTKTIAFGGLFQYLVVLSEILRSLIVLVCDRCLNFRQGLARTLKLTPSFLRHIPKDLFLITAIGANDDGAVIGNNLHDIAKIGVIKDRIQANKNNR